MKKLLLFFFWCNGALPLLAQHQVPVEGEISLADMQIKACPFQPEAHAMVLFDLQEIKFGLSDNYYAKLVTEHRVRIKIFDEKGYESATIRIPYYNKKRVTRIKDLVGAVYNLDSSGQIVIQHLKKDDFFKEKAGDKVDIINFTFTNVRPGSIIEYSYTKVEKEIIQIDPWIIQQDIPTAYASTILTTPDFSRIVDKAFGIDSIPQTTVKSSKGSRSWITHTYFIENVRSFEAEPFMSSLRDNLIRMVFLLVPKSSLMTDIFNSPDVVWKYAARELIGSSSIEGQLQAVIPGTQRLIDSAKKISSIAERIRFLFEAVQKRAPNNPEQTIVPDDISSAWANQNGNTAEVNLILFHLLQNANVISYPLLVSTRDHGKMDLAFPSPSQMNGLDVVAGDSDRVYIMDASIKYQSFETPPLNVLNRIALLVKPGNTQWFMISDPRILMRQSIDVEATMRPDGTIEGNAFVAYYNYAKSFVLDTAKNEEDEKDKFIDKKPAGLLITRITQDSMLAASDPLAEHVAFTYEPQSSGSFYFVNPQLFLKRENPFIKKLRATDIDFGCTQQFTLEFQLDLPPGFHVEELPKNIRVRAPDTSFFFTRSFRADSNRVYLSQDFEIQKPEFDKGDYPAIQEFFTRVYTLMKEEIIVKKE